MNKVRCAIYTRKSSEEGLEQSFNSLHAQHEACAAYVLSQASEGWTLLPEQYDDGGLSRGTLQRPALQRLLADIAAGTRTGRVVRMVQHNGKQAAQRGTNPAMIKLLAKSKALWAKLRSGETDIATLAREEKINDSYATRMVRLAFLSPEIVAAIMSGDQPASVNAASLLSSPIPTDWSEQARVANLCGDTSMLIVKAGGRFLASCRYSIRLPVHSKHWCHH